MTSTFAKTRIRLVGLGVAAVFILAPWFSSSAQDQDKPLRIAMRINNLPDGQLLFATGMASTGTLVCHGVTLASPRIFLISGREPPDDRQLMYFEQGSSAGRKWEIARKVNAEPCPGPDGVSFWLYEMALQEQ